MKESVVDVVDEVLAGGRVSLESLVEVPNDDGTIVADSTFIRYHIEKKYGFDFDACLGPEQKAYAWAVEKMCEEHLTSRLYPTARCGRSSPDYDRQAYG